MSHPMNGVHIQEQMDAYLDGELNPSDARKVQAHLAHCQDCQNLLAERCSLSALLQAAPAATGLKPAEQFIAEVGIQLKGRTTQSVQPSNLTNPLPWSWAVAPLVLLMAWIFLQTVSIMSNLLVTFPGAEKISQFSVQNIPIFASFSRFAGSQWLAIGQDLIAFSIPINTGWLTSLFLMCIIGLLYASWIAGWWVHTQNTEA